MSLNELFPPSLIIFVYKFHRDLPLPFDLETVRAGESPVDVPQYGLLFRSDEGGIHQHFL